MGNINIIVSGDLMIQKKKGMAQFLLLGILILVVGMMTADILNIKGSMTEQISNVDNTGYDVFINKPIDVSTYKTAKPILKIYSASIEHEFNSLHSSCARNDLYLQTPDGTYLNFRSNIYKYTNSPLAQVVLNADVLTEHFKGKDTIDIYATLKYTCSADTTPSTVYMTMELNDLQINYDPVECSTSDDCNDNRTDTTDICFEYQCNYIPVTPSTVEERTPDIILDINEDEDTTYYDYLDISRYIPSGIVTDEPMTPIDKINDILSSIKLWILLNLHI